MKKEERHALLLEKIKENPFLKDEELANECNVSVSTIRIDRAELGIAEYRERVKSVAQGASDAERAEILDLNLLHDGVAVLKTDNSMTFEGTDIIKGQSLYALAEELAVDVIDAKAAVVKVANIKYTNIARKGDRLVARSEVIRIKDYEYIVHVLIKANLKEVFRGKFSLLIPHGKGDIG